jgi:hypothetical protein
MRLQTSWRKLRAGRVGRRFMDFHRWAHRRSSALSAVAGGLMILLGLVLAFAPGPGFLFVLIGCAMIAARLRVVARTLDRLELCLRRPRRRAQSSGR